MAAQKESENFSLLSQTEQGCKKELREMEVAYYDYLVLPLSTLEAIHTNPDRRVMFERELVKVQQLTNGESNHSPFIGDIITENASDEKPKLGKRPLPPFFRNGQRISHIYDLLLSNRAIKIWEQKNFDILMGIEIAQCKAIKRYEQVLKEKIAELKTEIIESPEFDIISDEITKEDNGYQLILKSEKNL